MIRSLLLASLFTVPVHAQTQKAVIQKPCAEVQFVVHAAMLQFDVPIVSSVRVNLNISGMGSRDDNMIIRTDWKSQGTGRYRYTFNLMQVGNTCQVLVGTRSEGDEARQVATEQVTKFLSSFR